MTEEKLESLNRLSNRIKYIKKELKTLDYMQKNKNLYENMYFATQSGKISIFIPRSLHTLIYNELKNRLEIQLRSDESEFEKE